MRRDIRVKVLRWFPEEKKEFYQSYVVPQEQGMSVMDVLKYIQYNLDSSLTFYCSCKVGLCGGCTVRVNGKAILACAMPVKEGDLTIEPLREKRVRDLIG